MEAWPALPSATPVCSALRASYMPLQLLLLLLLLCSVLPSAPHGRGARSRSAALSAAAGACPEIDRPRLLSIDCIPARSGVASACGSLPWSIVLPAVATMLAPPSAQPLTRSATRRCDANCAAGSAGWWGSAADRCRRRRLRPSIKAARASLDAPEQQQPKPPAAASPPTRPSRLFSNLNPSSLKHEPGSVLGAAALVAGTTVGAGILALPAVTAESGFAASSAALVGGWLFSVGECFLEGRKRCDCWLSCIDWLPATCEVAMLLPTPRPVDRALQQRAC